MIFSHTNVYVRTTVCLQRGEGMMMSCDSCGKGNREMIISCDLSTPSPPSTHSTFAEVSIYDDTVVLL